MLAYSPSFFIRYISHLVVCCPGVEHTEAVVVLCRKDKILEAVAFEKADPLVGGEVCGIELVGQPPVPFLKISVRRFVGARFFAALCEPVVLRAKSPGFGNTGNRVYAPVEHDS